MYHVRFIPDENIQNILGIAQNYTLGNIEEQQCQRELKKINIIKNMVFERLKYGFKCTYMHNFTLFLDFQTIT